MDEARAKDVDRLLDALTQLVERPRAVLLRGVPPSFEPALPRLGVLDAGLVTDHPQELEVREDLAVHHLF